MKAMMRILGVGVLISAGLLGCKSAQESAGDKFLQAGNPVNAVVQYSNALSAGKVSSDFYPNYIQAYIQVLSLRSDEDPGAQIINDLQDTISLLLKQNPNPTEESDFANVLFDIGQKRLKLGTPEGEEGAFEFFRTADSLQNKPADLDSKIAAVQDAYVTAKLKEIKGDLDQVTKDDPQPGIVADYKMNELKLAVGTETPAMKALWSKIRQQNLSTYLMYDEEGLLDQVDARINKYGTLIGIVKYVPGPNVRLQLKVWNGSSGPLDFDGADFHLVDTSGRAYAPVAVLGAFKKKSDVPRGQESKTGGLNFKLPAGVKADYLELKVPDGRVTRKYLP